MLHAERLTCIVDDRPLFAALTLSLAAGELLQVAGDNGAGKTSLLRILCGLARPESGVVSWQGQPLAKVRESFHRQLLWLGHKPGVNAALTADENLRFFFPASRLQQRESALAAFSLCLLGTFLVRSGVLVSVHAFASDPSRGLFILVLLIVAIGGSLLLYALKGGRVRARVEHTLWSRETFLLGNNILLMAAMLVVLLGTLLPLVHKELGLGSISIGEPFFNTMFTALMAPFALLLGLGPLIRWRRDDVARQIKRLIIALLVTLSLSLALPWLLQDRITAMAVIGLMMALWVLIFALMEVHERATHRHGFWRGLRTLTRSQWGMVLGHVGVAVTVIGITFSQNYSVERDVRMRPGDSIDIHRYHFVFNGVRNIVGPNWTGGEGIIAVTRNGRPEATLYAEKRFYTASRMMMTEAAISGGLTRDLYAALGEELSDGSWAVRLYYKPFVRWIWYGGVLMALGGLCCMLDPRYRMRKKLQEAS